MEWCPAGWSVCLPLLIFPCTKKSRSSLLAPAHPSSPGKRAVKRSWCVVCGSCLYTLAVTVCKYHDDIMFSPPCSCLLSHRPLWLDTYHVDITRHWQDDWKLASVVNSSLVNSPPIQQPGFDLLRHCWTQINRFQTNHPPFPQIDIIGAVVIVWRARGKIIRSVLCNIVCNNCT